jgi:hypothetical protein
MWREVRHYARVDRPFGEVCRMLATDPERVVGHPGRDPDGHERLAGLRLRRAGVDLNRDVRVILGRLILDTDAARLPLRWEDARRPGLFPVLEASLELVPLANHGLRPLTRIGVVARYRPPLGRLGTMADDVAGNRIVLDSVTGFLDEVAGRIEEEIAPEQKTPVVVVPEPGLT